MYASVTSVVQNKMSEKEKNKLIVIAGPTASGKTRLAIEVAKQLKTEIVSLNSVDSACQHSSDTQFRYSNNPEYCQTLSHIKRITSVPSQ